MRKNKHFGTDFAKLDAHEITPAEYADMSEWTEEQFAAADLYEGGKLIKRGGSVAKAILELQALRRSTNDPTIGELIDILTRLLRAARPGAQGESTA